jgi:methionine-rich copper-binding protein CopC
MGEPPSSWKDGGVSRRSRWVAALALVAAIGWVAPAAAHTQLVSSSPQPGATVESPASVSLTFSEALLDIGLQIAVLDSQGGDHARGAAYFSDPRTVQVDVEPLAPGSYTTQWRVVAGDGHPIEGTLEFAVVGATVPSPPETSSPEQSPSASARPTMPTPTLTVSQDAPPISSGPDEHSGWSLRAMIAVGSLAAVLLALAIYLAVRRDPVTGSRRRFGG